MLAGRIAEFERRATHSPDSVDVHSTNADWRYIPIHPFSDDHELLANLNLAASDCRTVDAWCLINGDATLLESWTASGSGREPGLYARHSGNELGWIYLQLVTVEESITRKLFEDAMSQFALSGFPADLPELPNNGSAIRISEFHA